MIKWLKLRFIEDRIFYSKGHRDVFMRRSAIAKTELHVMHINHIKQAIMDNDRAEMTNRKKWLRMDGIKPPKTLKQCDKLIEDLRQWREM